MAITNALVVDDSRLARLTLTRLLEKRQIQVEKATSAREALECLKTARPDIILMDVTMPDIDGLEATRMITSNPETSSIPVVMCTAEDSDDARVKAEQCGATAFLTKPAGDENLDRVLKQIAERLESVQGASTSTATSDALPDVEGVAAAEPQTRVAAELVGDLTESVRAAVEQAFDARARDLQERVLAAAESRANAAAALMVEDVAARVAREALASREAAPETTEDLSERVADAVQRALSGNELTQRVRLLATEIAEAVATSVAERLTPVLAKKAATACARDIAAEAAREEARVTARKEAQEVVYQVDVEGLASCISKATNTARLALVTGLLALAAGVAAGVLL